MFHGLKFWRKQGAVNLSLSSRQQERDMSQPERWCNRESQRNGFRPVRHVQSANLRLGRWTPNRVG